MANLNQQIIEEDNEITHVGVGLNSSIEEARDNQRRMELTVKELNNNHLIFETLKVDFDSAQSMIRELEKKLSYQDIFFKEKRRNNEKMIKRMRTGLRVKDQCIVKLE